MAPPTDSEGRPPGLLSRAVAEDRRAERAAVIAARHETLAQACSGRQREFHERIAALHRRTEARHRAVRQVYESYRASLPQSTAHHSNTSRNGTAGYSGFVKAIAGASGSASAAVTFYYPTPRESVVAVSDPIAKAAQDAEFRSGVGPAWELRNRTEPLVVPSEALEPRWPELGATLLSLGVRTVMAAALGAPGASLGALTVYHTSERSGAGPETLSAVADALTEIALLPNSLDEIDGVPHHPLLDQFDLRPRVHQAAGRLAAERACSAQDALDLIRARAFTEDKTVDDVAADIVDNRTSDYWMAP